MEKEKERIVVVGFGWVGQANALAFLQDGYGVSFFDVAEPTLRYRETCGHLYSRIKSLKDPKEADSPKTVYLVSVGDRFDAENGVQDIEALRSALNGLRGVVGKVVLRSTVVPSSLASLPFDIYMPEFLHQKFAVEECRAPSLLVFGLRDGGGKIPECLAKFESQAETVFKGTPEEASYIKYLSNLWNTTRIAFTNEFGDAMSSALVPRERIDKVLDTVLKSKAYQRYGKAFDGHCLPKDIQSFIAAHKEHADVLQGVWNANEKHRHAGGGQTELPKWFSKWKE